MTGVVGLDAFVWEGAERDELRAQCCSSCDRLRHPPAARCPRCGSFDWYAATVDTQGDVHSFIVIHGSSDEVPSILVLIEFQGGIRLPAVLVDAAPDEVEIGLAGTLVFRDTGGTLVPCFELDRSTPAQGATQGETA